MENRDDCPSSVSQGSIELKFLRRALCTSYYDDEVNSMMKLMTYTKVKRIYFRKIDEQNDRKHGRKYKYAKGKQLSCITSLTLVLDGDSYDKKFIETLENLKNIKITLRNGSSIRTLVGLINIIPKNIETIALAGHNLGATIAGMKSLYRNLSACKELKTLRNGLSFRQEDAGLTEVEYNLINKYFAKLTNLKQLCCGDSKDHQQGLQKSLNQDQGCPSLTNLSLTLNEDTLEPNDLEDLEETRIHPLFRFHLLPSLRELKMSVCSLGDSIHMDPSIRQGFKLLPQLKILQLFISNKVQGRRFLLESLSHLPLLNVFDLTIYDIENDEELLLAGFIQKQIYLVSLKLELRQDRNSTSSRQRYEEHSRCLEAICQSLNYNPKLKQLFLHSPTWSLQTLSSGLSQVAMTNQLNELKIAGFDDLSIPKALPHSKIEGLCDFIQRQKQSLHILWINLGCVKDHGVIDTLIRAISEVDKLEFLDLLVNQDDFCPLERNELLQHIPKESLKGYPAYQNTFSLLKDILPRLNKLYSLYINLDPLILPCEVPVIDSSVFFEVLPALKNLSWLELRLPFVRQSMKARPSQALLLCQLKSLTYCYISTAAVDSNGLNECIEEVDEVLLQTQEERFRRNRLRFE